MRNEVKVCERCKGCHARETCPWCKQRGQAEPGVPGALVLLFFLLLLLSVKVNGQPLPKVLVQVAIAYGGGLMPDVPPGTPPELCGGPDHDPCRMP